MAAIVHAIAAEPLFTRPMDVTANMDFNHDLELSLPFDQARRSTNIDGLPTPAPTQRNSHGTTPTPISPSSPRHPRSSPLVNDADPEVSILPNPYHRESASPPPGAALPTPQRYSSDRRTSRSPPPPNPDAQRQLTESPTSYGNAANEYAEGFRLFPPSPASSLPRPQTLDTQQREVDPEPEPVPEQDGRPSWDNRQWFRDQRPEPGVDITLPPRRESHPQQHPAAHPSHDPSVPIRARDDAQWAQSWRRDEQPWPEPTPRARAEVRVSGSARAPAQQPTVVAAPPPIQQQQVQPQVEEVCIECAMRDQDMADVDVTSPGVWARESDVAYEEILQREIAEEEAGVVSDDMSRPRARGGRLTEANLRLWLTLNPKEPTSKRANLEAYVRSQYALLEAETVARARALQESRQIDDRMRDTYSALRRSTYDLHSPEGGVRLEGSGHGRDVTLLENGLIVEHVDVRREEKAKRREEKKARGRSRKSSRGSVADVASLYSLGSPALYGDNGGLAARSSSSRPMSVLTAPIMGESFSGSQSVIGLGASMPQSLSTMSVESPNRRTRFFGMRNFSQGFRSSDSLAAHSGFSGSMVDMHVALQKERAPYGQQPRPSSLWHEYRAPQSLEPQRPPEALVEEEKPKKKKKGLAKLWGLVTGSSKSNAAAAASSSNPQTRSLDREEDIPLAPPPPMSYLASRGNNREGGQRHVSTPSLPASSMPNGYGSSSTGISPPSAPSSILPSPTSSRPLVGPEAIHIRKGSGGHTHESDPMMGSSIYGLQPPVVLKPVEESPSPIPTPRGVSLGHMTSEPDMRARLSLADAPPVPRIPATISAARPISWRDKSLPPLPGEMGVRAPDGTRPRTLFGMYDDLEPPASNFRQEAGRRQSFSGLASYPSASVQQSASYGEMGMETRQVSGSTLAPPVTPSQSKRKSKFLGALLGRARAGSASHESHATAQPQQQQYRSSGSEARHEAMVSVGVVQASPVASPQAHVFPRMSMSLASRKNIETLVDQAPDFVAYRYPSGAPPMSHAQAMR